MPSYQYRKSNCVDNKTILRSSYLHNGISYTSLYWIRALEVILPLMLCTLPIVHCADQRKHQSPASLAFVRVIHRLPVNSLHKWPITQEMFPFGDVTMTVKMVDFECTKWILDFALIYKVLCVFCDYVRLMCCYNSGHCTMMMIKWKHFPRYWPFVWGIHWSRWIPCTKASDAELWCFIWSMSELTSSLWRQCNDIKYYVTMDM